MKVEHPAGRLVVVDACVATHALFRRVTVNWRFRRLGMSTEGLPTDQRRIR